MPETRRARARAGITKRQGHQRGNSTLEFALCWLFLMVFFCGMIVTGIILCREMQTSQVSRDGGHMFARWVDFSVDSNKDIVVRLASGLNMTRTGGDGVVYFTQVMYVDDTQCNGAGLTNAQCPNWHKYVILKQVSVGNTGLRSSAYGTPNPSIQNGDGSISSPTYLTNASVVVPTGAVLPTLSGGEFAYVSESCFNLPSLSLPYFTQGNGMTYAYSIF